MQNASNLVWVDMEMTGLDPDGDVVIEIATIVTDTDLNTLAEGPVIAVHQSDERLAAMDEWNTTHHTRSGLVDRVKASQYDEQQTARETMAFLEQWVPAAPLPCAATLSARTGALWRATCRSWRPISTIATWMSVRSRF